MKIINRVDNDTLQIFGYEQWIEKFVKDVVNQVKFKCKVVTIEDIEFSKRIILSIDGKEYNIRTWSFHPVNDFHGEIVDYTLFEIIKDENGGYGNEISNGMVRIKWKRKN